MDKKLLLIAGILLILFGCTESQFQDSIKNLTDEMRPTNFTLNASDDVKNNTLGECMAMVCQNKTPMFPFSLFIDSSLQGGNCSFQPCNETKYNDTVHGKYPAISIRFFMFGAGHSFLSFSDANQYCNNSMKMSVKWLTATNYSSYPVPTAERAECFLDKNIIPVYILYSNLTSINATRASEIASALSGAGPAILITDAELDDSNASRYSLIKDQAYRMKINCPKCLVALGIKLNGTSEYNVTRDLFSDPVFMKSIDLVAYGLNSHYFAECNPARLLSAALNYSKFILYNYTKPSLISYALFDAANSSDNSCAWSNDTSAAGYSLIYQKADAMVASGIIGASIYSLYGLGPLQCESCAFINPSSDSCGSPYATLEKIDPRFTNYMGFCQAYYTGLGENISGIMPLVFSNGSRECNFAANTNIFRFIDNSGAAVRPFIGYDIEKTDAFFSCGGCFSNGTVPAGIPTASGSSDYCTKYSPSIEIAADNFDMDPALLRAAVWQESTFDKCAVSVVNKTNSKCNSLNLTTMTDPDTGACPCGTISAQPGNKTCAYGLAQTIDYPWDIYKDNPSLSIPEAIRVCASKTVDGYPDFNPFRPYDSACAYAFKFMRYNKPDAENLVSSNSGKLNASDGNTKEWLSVFLALYQINGYSSSTEQGWIDDFDDQKGKSASACGGNKTSCCGNSDFFNYVYSCKGATYGYSVLSKYNWLTKNCADSQCPDESKGDRYTVQYLCENKYMNESCCNAAKIPATGIYSANYMCYLNPSTPLACEEKYC